MTLALTPVVRYRIDDGVNTHPTNAEADVGGHLRQGNRTFPPTVSRRHALVALGLSTLVVGGTGVAVFDAEPEYAAWYLAIAGLLALLVAITLRQPMSARVAGALAFAAAALAVWHSLFVVDRVFFGVSVLLIALPCLISFVLVVGRVRALGRGGERRGSGRAAGEG